MQDTIQETTILHTVTSIVHKLFIMQEMAKWSRAARKALKDMDRTSAEIAIQKYNELADMIKGDE